MTAQGHIQGLHRRDRPEKSGCTSQDHNRKMHWVATSAIKAAGAALNSITVRMAKVGMLESLISAIRNFLLLCNGSFLLQLENVDPMFRFAARSQSGKL